MTTAIPTIVLPSSTLHVEETGQRHARILQRKPNPCSDGSEHLKSIETSINRYQKTKVSIEDLPTTHHHARHDRVLENGGSAKGT
jgi:hypothetical protein